MPDRLPVMLSMAMAFSFGIGEVDTRTGQNRIHC
jgi:hypothetical protein